jgi:hypothetical protein
MTTDCEQELFMVPCAKPGHMRSFFNKTCSYYKPCEGQGSERNPRTMRCVKRFKERCDPGYIRHPLTLGCVQMMSQKEYDQKCGTSKSKKEMMRTTTPIPKQKQRGNDDKIINTKKDKKTNTDKTKNEKQINKKQNDKKQINQKQTKKAPPPKTQRTKRDVDADNSNDDSNTNNNIPLFQRTKIPQRPRSTNDPKIKAAKAEGATDMYWWMTNLLYSLVTEEDMQKLCKGPYHYAHTKYGFPLPNTCLPYGSEEKQYHDPEDYTIDPWTYPDDPKVKPTARRMLKKPDPVATRFRHDVDNNNDHYYNINNNDINGFLAAAHGNDDDAYDAFGEAGTPTFSGDIHPTANNNNNVSRRQQQSMSHVPSSRAPPTPPYYGFSSASGGSTTITDDGLYDNVNSY